MNLVSVVIPFYQKEKNILRSSIESLLRQQLPDGWTIEVIIVDDGSPVKAKNEISGIDQRDNFIFRVIEQDNSGVAAARNRGIDEISDHSTLVAFLDSDDFWPVNYIENAITSFDLGYDLCFTDNSRDKFHLSHLKSCASKTTALAQKSAPHKNLYNLPSEEFMSLIIEEFPCQISTVTYKNSVAKNLRFDNSLNYAGEDMLFMVMLADKCHRISCNLNMVVECGSGINIYFSNFGWDSPKFFHILFDRLKCYYLISQLPNVPKKFLATNRVFLKTSLKNSFFHIFRYLYKNRGTFPSNIMNFVTLLPAVLRVIILR